MIEFFRNSQDIVYAVRTDKNFNENTIEKLSWLFGNATFLHEKILKGHFIGPRKEMITPWSTNAVEITKSMGITGIDRIEKFSIVKKLKSFFDPMLENMYINLDQDIFTIYSTPLPIIEIDDIAAYNEKEGLALNDEEINYLREVSAELGRPLTDSEVFGFSQVNSEHCRHKIFNGTFIIDGQKRAKTLFQLIRETSAQHPNKIISAYKDNVAFISGPVIEQFAPDRQDVAGTFETKDMESVISLKAETHNFPTTVEPFNGAATGAGGEIRDRLAGGRGSLPLAGTAVYMTSYSRIEKDRAWEKNIKEREWLYQTPIDILIKASDGASDFGNKFGQPLIAGSVLTYEYFGSPKKYGYDKVIMLAGGIGFGKMSDSQKGKVEPGDQVVILGGDNYRIGMGGGAVSSVATGQFENMIELNAVQRSNPEMQKRVMNVIRALQEADDNPIVSIHDHGAGGHLNCLSELLEETGGDIQISKLPVGDPTLSEKEIIGNESQERMGLVLKTGDLLAIERISERERSPLYVAGHATGNNQFRFIGLHGKNPIDWKVRHMLGSSPKTVLTDQSDRPVLRPLHYEEGNFSMYLHDVLQLEAVACKDWLTNKVDRSVTGKVATQQTCGEIQLPLNNLGVMALDFNGIKGVATSIGHAPGAGLIDPAAASQLAIAEALTNLIWAPLTFGLEGVSLSANWMWPAKVEGENARLYEAVEAASNFAISLGINIPTGKDSLSMTQKYPNGEKVHSPGTVIISTVGEVEDIRKTVTPVLKSKEGSFLYYIDFSGDTKKLGGSSFAQVLNALGDQAPTIKNPVKFIDAFNTVQSLIKQGKIMAGHDIGSGGLITSLLEMCFTSLNIGMELNIPLTDEGLTAFLFAENPGIVIQAEEEVEEIFKKHGISTVKIGIPVQKNTISLQYGEISHTLHIEELRDRWFKTSYLLDIEQRGDEHATLRFENYKKQPLRYVFPKNFKGHVEKNKPSKVTAAIIREKGVNGDREMAWSLYKAGFKVKDIHMTDLVSGREDLTDVHMIVFVGGFSNSDVLGSAKGWAGAFLYNQKAKLALDNFYQREDTLSLGVCNGCQLMMELDLLYPDMKNHPKMLHNGSHKFESSFVTINIEEVNSIMLQPLKGTRLGAWVAHGEGRFSLSETPSHYNIAARFSYDQYPGNPNGSDLNTAALCSKDGRHLAIMPHIERSLYPWNWPHYPEERIHSDEISPWIMAFESALEWVQERVENAK